MGLSREHHGELNKLYVNQKRYDELRLEYKDDFKALKQIDIYDPSTEYHSWLRTYKVAILQNDSQLISKCEKWFRENGYE